MTDTPKTTHEKPQQPRRVCVMGLGYIGLPTAAVLAQHGFDVIGVDIRPEVIDTINRGQIHIHEPGLGELVNEVVQSGNLRASLTPEEADVFFICVPTPINDDKTPDLSYVDAASKAIRPYLRRGSLIVLESTSPPKTTEQIVAERAIPAGWTVGQDVYVAHCPERVLPGQILREVVENDRIVGGMTDACTDVAARFYEAFVSGAVLRTSAVTAELTKLIENSYRDVNIAFANELSMLANELGTDPFEVIELANRHPRVNVLTPGPGVGGHCISVDPWFVADAAPNCTPLIQTARAVNDAKPDFVVEQVRAAASAFESPVIGCLGLAYKGDVDDLRESPSLEIVRELRNETNYEVLVCEPYVATSSFTEFSLLPLADVVRRSDVLVLLTNHTQFRNLPCEVLRAKTLVDTQGVWREQLKQSMADELRTRPMRLRAA